MLQPQQDCSICYCGNNANVCKTGEAIRSPSAQNFQGPWRLQLDCNACARAAVTHYIHVLVKDQLYQTIQHDSSSDH